MVALRALAFPAFILAFGAVSLTAQSERVSQPVAPLARAPQPPRLRLTSPAFRARETATTARLDGANTAAELGDNGQSMGGVTEEQAAWLRARAGERPASGNSVLVTHQPNFARAFPEWGASVQQGEMVVFRPDGKGGFTVAGRIPIGDWPRLK